jgi:uncharacterized surface protein with fasciclin (FAS1) repeats
MILSNVKRMLLPLVIITSLMIAFIATPVSANAWSGSSVNTQPNIVQTAVANGNFTTLAQALTCTDLAGVLQTKWLRFTVFAPNDAAFSKAGLNKDNVCQKYSKSQLRNILLYHVNLGSKDANQVLARNSLLMLNFRNAPINPSVPSIAGQKIVATNIQTSNGIIHVIDGVMIP